MVSEQMLTVDEIQNSSLSDIRQKFQQLDAPNSAFLTGFFRASFIGPWWLRKTAYPSLSLSGLPNWQGKKFIDPHIVTNILQSAQGLEEKYLMSCLEGPSMVDGKVGIYLDYGSQAPLPWRWVRDELRLLDERTLLCMTVIDFPILRHFPMPFLLTREA